MIKEKELFDGRKIRFANGNGITLDAIKVAISDEADKNGIPVAFYDEQVKFGGLIGRSVENCTVLYHPEHKKDYFNFVLRVTNQGNYAFLSIDTIGVSKMGGKLAVRENRKEAMKGQSLGFKLGYAITSSITSMGASRAKMEQEENWYAIVADILDYITGATE